MMKLEQTFTIFLDNLQPTLSLHLLKEQDSSQMMVYITEITMQMDPLGDLVLVDSIHQLQYKVLQITLLLTSVKQLELHNLLLTFEILHGIISALQTEALQNMYQLGQL